MRIRPTAAVLSIALGVVLTGCGGGTEPRSGGTGTGRQAPTSAGSSGPTVETQSDVEPQDLTPTPPTNLTSTAPSGDVTVPVYFVGSTPQGKRLFREFQRVPGDDPLLAAAELATSDSAKDPDYRTLYRNGDRIESVEYDATADLVTVQVTDDAWADRLPGMSRREAKLAAQQLVYTLQGVVQSRAGVEVVGQPGGDAVPLFGIETIGGLHDAAPAKVLASVSVTTPEQGADVGSTSFVASGVANSFEANVPWEIRDPDGKVVRRGFATAAGWGAKLYPWRTKVKVSGLPAGDYTFVAMTDDPSGGEGPGPTEDSKDITVG